MGMVNKLLVLVGPTAVGKTSLSLRLAQELDGEIISADSRLFYRGMDIGTAKPSLVEQFKVPHHLIDICEPDRTMTLAEYQSLAYTSIDGVLERGRLPILVGGTGQYILAVVEGWGIPEVPPQPSLREELAQLGEAEGYRWLEALDAPAASKIDPRNNRRVIRALEVTLTTGRPISELQRKSPPPHDIFLVGLMRNRDELYRRIDQRVEQMIADGLVDEVESLHKAGNVSTLPSMSGLGYRQVLAFLDGELTLEETVQRIKFETHRFARQQSTWFRKDDPRIHWFDLGSTDTEDAIIELVQQWLNNCLA